MLHRETLFQKEKKRGRGGSQRVLRFEHCVPVSSACQSCTEVMVRSGEAWADVQKSVGRPRNDVWKLGRQTWSRVWNGGLQTPLLCF